MKLSSQERHNLDQGARHPDGLIYPMRMSNFDKPEKRMAKLMGLGLVEATDKRGYWKITEAGRQCLAQQ